MDKNVTYFKIFLRHFGRLKLCFRKKGHQSCLYTLGLLKKTYLLNSFIQNQLVDGDDKVLNELQIE